MCSLDTRAELSAPELQGKAFSASKQAFASGNGARAHELSAEGKQHQANKERLNLQAAQYIFDANNASQPSGSIDLHGLYVKESITMTERAIANARSQGLSELRVIVGKGELYIDCPKFTAQGTDSIPLDPLRFKGNHSPAHVAKIKPAIEELMQKERLSAYVDPHNAGVLIVQIQGQGGGKGAREVLGDMDNNPNICVVM